MTNDAIWAGEHWVSKNVNKKLIRRWDSEREQSFFTTKSHTQYKIQYTRAYIPPQIDAVM